MSRGLTAVWILAAVTFALGGAIAAEPPYQWRELHDPNGIGKFYLGREIAQVMGHEAADWLERPEREEEEKPSVLLSALPLKPGEAVADVGAGSGYFTLRMAQKVVGGSGRVYAVDIQPEMLDIIRAKAAAQHLTNVVPVLGTITNTALPTNAIDLVLMVDVYHEFSHPYEMMQSICGALKPGGWVVFVEYRAEDPLVPIKVLHKMSETQLRKEMTPLPLRWVQTLTVLPRQHVIIFAKAP